MYFQCDGYAFHVVRRSNARRISMSVRPGADYVSLSVPLWVTKREAEQFIRQNLAWLSEHARKADQWKPSYERGEVHPCLGTFVTLGQQGVPAGKAFVSWRQKQLEEMVARLVRYWSSASKMNVRVRSIRYDHAVSRWGACAPRTAALTFSTNLACVPKLCVEYVVVHELCHLHHPDHSPAFHAEMTRLLPDWEDRKKKLNEFDPTPRPGTSGSDHRE